MWLVGVCFRVGALGGVRGGLFNCLWGMGGGGGVVIRLAD